MAKLVDSSLWIDFTRTRSPRALKLFVAAMQAWSLVHGLSMLILDEQVEPKAAEAMIDRIISNEGLRLG